MVYVKFLESDEAKFRVVRLLVQVVRRPVAPHSTIPKNFSYMNDRLRPSYMQNNFSLET